MKATKIFCQIFVVFWENLSFEGGYFLLNLRKHFHSQLLPISTKKIAVHQLFTIGWRRTEISCIFLKMGRKWKYLLKITQLYQISFFQVNSTVGVIRLHVSLKQPQRQSCPITCGARTSLLQPASTEARAATWAANWAMVGRPPILKRPLQWPWDEKVTIILGRHTTAWLIGLLPRPYWRRQTKNVSFF